MFIHSRSVKFSSRITSHNFFIAFLSFELFGVFGFFFFHILSLLIGSATKYYQIIKFTVYLKCVGGEVGATSSLAPKIGPLGLVSLILFLLFNISYFS